MKPLLSIGMILLVVCGCGDSSARQQAEMPRPDLLISALEVFEICQFAGFDANALQQLQAGNSTERFLLRTNDRYWPYYLSMKQSQNFKTLVARIRRDSVTIANSYHSALNIIDFGSIFYNQSASIALGFVNDTAGVLYWTAMDSSVINIGKLSRKVSGMVASLPETHPGSVDEISDHGDRLALVGIASSSGCYNLVAGQVQSFLGLEYDSSFFFRSKIPRSTFTWRRSVDSLLWIVTGVKLAGSEERWEYPCHMLADVDAAARTIIQNVDSIVGGDGECLRQISDSLGDAYSHAGQDIYLDALFALSRQGPPSVRSHILHEAMIEAFMGNAVSFVQYLYHHCGQEECHMEADFIESMRSVNMYQAALEGGENNALDRVVEKVRLSGLSEGAKEYLLSLRTQWKQAE